MLLVTLTVWGCAGSGAGGKTGHMPAAEALEPAGTTETGTEAEEDTPDTAAADTPFYTLKDLETLEHTSIFARGTLEHIFSGSINKKGNATGYHYEGISDSRGETVEGTASEPDGYGVYEAKVRVDGVDKSGNNGYSTFFPESMSPQEVVDAINEAYENREHLSGDLYAGLAENGMEIDMYLYDDGKISTAYPVME